MFWQPSAAHCVQLLVCLWVSACAVWWCVLCVMCTDTCLQVLGRHASRVWCWHEYGLMRRQPRVRVRLSVMEGKPASCLAQAVRVCIVHIPPGVLAVPGSARWLQCPCAALGADALVGMSVSYGYCVCSCACATLLAGLFQAVQVCAAAALC
jgi:hypothetical protein